MLQRKRVTTGHEEFALGSLHPCWTVCIFQTHGEQLRFTIIELRGQGQGAQSLASVQIAPKGQLWIGICIPRGCPETPKRIPLRLASRPQKGIMVTTGMGWIQSRDSQEISSKLLLTLVIETNSRTSQLHCETHLSPSGQGGIFTRSQANVHTIFPGNRRHDPSPEH